MSTMLQFISDPIPNQNENIDGLQFDPSESRKHKYIQDMITYSQLGIFPTMYLKTNLTGEETLDLESRINDAMSPFKDH